MTPLGGTCSDADAPGRSSAEAGVTPASIAQAIEPGLRAERTISVDVVGEGEECGKRKRRERVTEPDWHARATFLDAAVTLLGMRPEVRQRLLVESKSLSVSVVQDTSQVPDWMLGLRGETLQRAYMDRIRAQAAGLPPPPLDNYLTEE